MIGIIGDGDGGFGGWREPEKPIKVPEPSRPPKPGETRPPPKPHYDDSLSELVASGDIARVRGYFDTVFWDGRKERPEWSHLRIALLREDRPMLRLLGAWGASPSEEDLSSFRALAKEKYADYLKLLRAAGLRPGATAWEDITPAVAPAGTASETLHGVLAATPVSPWKVEKLPGEWRTLLNAFQETGAAEAVIAGGALRDLFNDRPVKDVDIFMRSRGSQRKNRNFLKEAFAAANLAVVTQEIGGGYNSISTAFPDPRTISRQTTDGNVKRERKTESWNIIAGPGKTEYNVVFVDDNLDRKLAETRPKADQRSLFCGGLMESFDIALCRIACDGHDVVSTPEYRDDVKYRRISLLLENDSTVDHLQRIIKKYDDWQLNPAAQQALVPKPPPPRSSSSYDYY